MRRQLRLPPDRPDQRAVAWNAIEAGARLGAVFRPKLLVLDEPFSGLDALTRDEILASFCASARDVDPDLISTSWDRGGALCTDVAFLD